MNKINDSTNDSLKVSGNLVMVEARILWLHDSFISWQPMEEAAFVYQQEKFTDSKNSKINIRLPIAEKVCIFFYKYFNQA